VVRVNTLRSLVPPKAQPALIVVLANI